MVSFDLRKAVIKTVEAIFDGEVLRPEEPLGLQPNTRVRLTIEIPESKGKRGSFLRTARSLNLEGPSNWPERIEENPYGRQSDARKGSVSRYGVCHYNVIVKPR